MGKPDNDNKQGDNTDDPIEQRMRELERMQKDQIPSVETLQKLAAQALKQFDGMMNIMGEDDIAFLAADLHRTLSNLTDQDLMAANFLIMQMKQGEVGAYLKQAYRVGVDHDAVTRSVENAQKIIGSIGEDEYVSIITAVTDVYPSRMKAMVESAVGSSIEDYARKRYVDLTTKSAEDLASEQVEKSKKVPVEKLAAVFMDAVDNATPDNLAKAAKHFTDNVRPDEFGKLAKGGLKLTREILGAAAQGQLSALDKTKLDPDFVPTLKHVFQAAEDALAEAGILPDTNKVASLLRAANDNGTAPQAPSIKPPAL